MSGWSVYSLFDSEGNALYVGFSTDSALRLAQHTRTSEWWERVATARFEHFADKGVAHEREIELIRDLDPAYNIRHRFRHPRKGLREVAA